MNLETDFLSNKNYLKGVFLNYLERLFGDRKYQWKFESGYKLIKKIKTQKTIEDDSVGIYETKDQKKVLVKSLSYKYKNLAYLQLNHEAKMLLLLGTLAKKLKSKKIGFPGLLSVVKNKGTLHIVSEYIDGKTLKNEKSPSKKMSSINSILDFFDLISDTLTEEEQSYLPKRYSVQNAFSYPVYLVAAVYKDIADVKRLARLTVKYYHHYFEGVSVHRKYIISHRDLDPENILIRDKFLRIIDPEITVLADPVTDLATMCRYFIDEVGIKDIEKLLSRRLRFREDKSKFIELTIFYTVQMLSTGEKNSYYYLQAKNYLKLLEKNILPFLEKDEKSFYEYLNKTGLILLLFINKIKIGKI